MLKRVVLLFTLLSISICSLSCGWESEHQKDTWISPDKINVGNFHNGAKVEGLIRVHNGNEFKTEKYQIITEPNETMVALTVKQQIVDYKASNIKSLTSDNAQDDLKIINCDGNRVNIKGFAPNTSRVIEIVYRYNAKFEITYEPAPDKFGYTKTPDNASSWVKISEANPILAPYETKDIPITLEIPDDADPVQGTWRFRIIAYDATQTGLVDTRLASTWIVAMR